MVLTLAANTPTLLLQENDKRRKLVIQMQPFDVDNNNTGRIHVGFGFQPVATVGHGAQGEVLLGGSSIAQPTGNIDLDPKYKRSIWVTSSSASQTIIFDEEVATG